MRIANLLWLVLILAPAIYVRCYEIDRPWVSVRDRGSAHAALEARNYLRYGYLETRLGAVDYATEGTQRKFHYYLNHSPLRPLVLSVSFLLLGVHEWSARLTGLVFSVLSVLLLWQIGKEVYDRKTGLISALFLAFMPGMIFYGVVNFFEVFTGFGVLLVLYGYLLWVRRRKFSFFILALIGVLWGGISDWPFFFLLPGLALPHLLSRERREMRLKPLLLLLLVAVLTGGLCLAYLVLLSGSPKDLYVALFSRIGLLRGEAGARPIVSLGQFAGGTLGRLGKLITPPLLTAAALWGLVLLVRSLRRRTDAGEVLILGLLSVPLLNVFLFVKGAWLHEQWWYYFGFPAALYSARCVTFLGERLGSRKWTGLRGVFVIGGSLFLALFGWFSYQAAAEMFREKEWFFYDAGMAAREVVDEGKKILVPHSRNQLYYYPDIGVEGTKKIEYYLNVLPKRRLLKNMGFDFYLMPVQEKYVESNRSLFRRYRAIDFRGTFFFDLSQDPDPDFFKREVSSQQVLGVDFEGKIGLLGMDVLRGTYRRDVKLTLSWECLEEMEKDYSLRIRLINSEGEAVLERRDPFFYGLYPTSEWKVGEKIVDTRRLMDEKGHLPLGCYLIELEVFCGGERLKGAFQKKKGQSGFGGIMESRGEKEGRILLGEIEI